MNTPGLLAALAVLAAATAFGLWRRRTDGTVRVAEFGTELLSAADLGSELGSRVTLLQFSSAVCAPCDATRRILSEVATHDVAHIEIDAETRLDLVRRLAIRRTPTVLILDSAGRVSRRISGAPRPADVRAAIDGLDAVGAAS